MQQHCRARCRPGTRRSLPRSRPRHWPRSASTPNCWPAGRRCTCSSARPGWPRPSSCPAPTCTRRRCRATPPNRRARCVRPTASGWSGSSRCTCSACARRTRPPASSVRSATVASTTAHALRPTPGRGRCTGSSGRSAGAMPSWRTGPCRPWPIAWLPCRRSAHACSRGGGPACSAAAATRWCRRCKTALGPCHLPAPICWTTWTAVSTCGRSCNAMAKPRWWRWSSVACCAPGCHWPSARHRRWRRWWTGCTVMPSARWQTKAKAMATATATAAASRPGGRAWPTCWR